VARQDGIEVHLFQYRTAVFVGGARYDFEVSELASVSARPCVSTYATTTSVPLLDDAPSSSIR